MKIIAGRYAGHDAKLHQYANDWLSVDITACHRDTDGDSNCHRCTRRSTSIIVSPGVVELDDADEGRLFKPDAPGSASTGFFHRVFALGEDRRFYLREELPK